MSRRQWRRSSTYERLTCCQIKNRAKLRAALINCAGKIITGGVGRWYLMVLNGVKEVGAASRAAAARQRRSSGSATLRTQRDAALARFGKAAR